MSEVKKGLVTADIPALAEIEERRSWEKSLVEKAILKRERRSHRRNREAANGGWNGRPRHQDSVGDNSQA